MNISFPITVEAFSAIQEKLSHRLPNKNELELIPIIVEDVNLAFDAGRNGYENWPESVAQITEAGIDISSPVAEHFFLTLLRWRNMAYLRGCECAKKSNNCA